MIDEVLELIERYQRSIQIANDFVEMHGQRPSFYSMCRKDTDNAKNNLERCIDEWIDSRIEAALAKRENS